MCVRPQLPANSLASNGLSETVFFGRIEAHEPDPDTACDDVALIVICASDLLQSVPHCPVHGAIGLAVTIRHNLEIPKQTGRELHSWQTVYFLKPALPCWQSSK